MPKRVSAFVSVVSHRRKKKNRHCPRADPHFNKQIHVCIYRLLSLLFFLCCFPRLYFLSKKEKTQFHIGSHEFRNQFRSSRRCSCSCASYGPIQHGRFQAGKRRNVAELYEFFHGTLWLWRHDGSTTVPTRSDFVNRSARSSILFIFTEQSSSIYYVDEHGVAGNSSGRETAAAAAVGARREGWKCWSKTWTATADGFVAGSFVINAFATARTSDINDVRWSAQLRHDVAAYPACWAAAIRSRRDTLAGYANEHSCCYCSWWRRLWTIATCIRRDTASSANDTPVTATAGRVHQDLNLLASPTTILWI